MITILLLASAVLAPAAILVLKGPGELELMTTPKNLGLPGAELPVRRTAVRLGRVETIVGTDAVVEGSHTSAVPTGMRPVRTRA